MITSLFVMTHDITGRQSERNFFSFIFSNFSVNGYLFFHHSDIQMEGYRCTKLNNGQTVEYEIGENKKGPCARNVKAASVKRNRIGSFLKKIGFYSRKK